jgi:N4-(beta-N-acetylglucosaminyl)-L-asparaginase
MNRRKFLKTGGQSAAGLGAASLVPVAALNACVQEKKEAISPTNKPLVIATWNVPNATAEDWKALKEGQSALDAVERGTKIEEADTKNQSVGKGGRPDRDGQVTLDACIMDHQGNCGAVVYLQNITHAVSVARKVMEETPHVMLAGDGAEKFAYEQGFQKENLLTEASEKGWKKWLETAEYQPVINIENHDTIGMLALDDAGNLSGACTTSGMAFKMAGRVGDSPIIGAGLFVDNEVGAATATGMGEEVVKTVGSFLVVELMRQGYSPQKACEEAINRIVKNNPKYKDIQVGYIALNKQGEYGGHCIHPGFSYRVFQESGHENFPGSSYL